MTKVTWKDRVTYLRGFFESIDIPTTPIQLNKFTRLENPRLFVDSHMKFIECKEDNETYLPYMRRLYEFKKYLETHK